jgi:Secretion system C-terminal sorting domain
MKHTLLFLALLVCATSFSQIVNIPDPLFKQRLVEYNNPVIDTNDDGEIQVSEAEAVTVLSFGGGPNSEIGDFTGIGSFINLELFFIQSATATTINLSNNLNLQEISMSIGSLESIVLPSTSSLKRIGLWRNNLSGIDLSNVSGLEFLWISENNLSSLDISGNTNLVDILLYGNELNSLNLSNNLNVENLSLYDNPLNSLNVSSLISLNSLNVSDTNIASIELSNNLELTFLRFGNIISDVSPIANIDLSNNIALEFLTVGNSLISELNISENFNLKSLGLIVSQLSTINTSSNNQLEGLFINGGSVSSLDLSSNVNLKNLSISSCPISNLDISNNTNLEELSLINIPLTNVDLSQNSSLDILRLFSLNNLNSIDISNIVQLSSLEISAGAISNIVFPANNYLLSFSLRYSQFSEVDLSSLSDLCIVRIFANSQLNSLNIKNGNNSNLIFLGNFCVPDLYSILFIEQNPNLNFVCVDDAAFAATNFNNTSPYITFTEDCTLNSNDLNQIQGLVSYDMDANGCTSGNLPLDGFVVSSSDGTNTFANGSNNGGNYNINLSENTYTTSMVGLPTYFEATPASVSDTFVGFNQVEQQDFCVQATITANDLNVSINPQYAPVPGGTGLYSVVYQNAGTTELAATVTMSFDNDKMTFDSAEPAPSSQTASSLTWDLGTLPVFTTDALEVRFDLEGALNIGTPLEFSASIEPIAGDATPEDNEFTLVDFVAPEPFVDGMDVPQGAEELIEDAGNYLNYVVNFENNTGSIVEDILISTILSDNLDVATLQIINSSHPVTLQLYNNEVYFNLEDINLPEVENSGGGGNNAGYVMYRARPISSIALGDVVASSAIVFLDGSPRFTNTVQTRFVDVLDTPDFNTLEIGLYPNPTTGIFKVSASELIEIITVYTISGQQLKRVENIQKKETTLDIEALATGIYFAQVKTTQGEKVFRVLKQ